MKNFIQLAKKVFLSIIFTTELEFLTDDDQPIKIGGIGTDNYLMNIIEAIGEFTLCILSTMFMVIILPFLLMVDIDCELSVGDEPINHVKQMQPLELICKLPFLQRALMCVWVSVASLLLGVISILTAFVDLLLSAVAMRLY